MDTCLVHLVLLAVWVWAIFSEGQAAVEDGAELPAAGEDVFPQLGRRARPGVPAAEAGNDNVAVRLAAHRKGGGGERGERGVRAMTTRAGCDWVWGRESVVCSFHSFRSVYWSRCLQCSASSASAACLSLAKTASARRGIHAAAAAAAAAVGA